MVAMRGELNEALDRLARRDEALRRRTGVPEEPRSAATELVSAARRLVDENPELSVTVTVESGRSCSSVRLEHGQPPRLVEAAAPSNVPAGNVPAGDVPVAGGRPVELGAEDAVVLDPAPQQSHHIPAGSSRMPTNMARLAKLLREDWAK
jgi:hypothetical protein